MSLCPFATLRPISTNHGGARSAALGLVIHVQQGDGSLYGYFNNPASQVSAHFWCSETGQLEQYLDTDVVAWAEAAGNDSYASCEFEGFDTAAMTDAQVAVGGRLAAWLSSEEGWPIVGPVTHGSPGVTPHCNPNGTPDPAWGNHSCPGSVRLAQIPAIVAAAHPAPPDPTGSEEGMTNWQEGGQNHLAGVIPGVGAFHWWQAIGGNPAGQPEWWCQKLTETPVVP